MPAYRITHAENKRGDMLIEDPALRLAFEAGWVVFRDKISFEQGSVVLALPAEQVASVQRVDEPQEHEPAPQKE